MHPAFFLLLFVIFKRYKWKSSTSNQAIHQMHLLEKVKNRMFMKTQTYYFRQWSRNTLQLIHERTITMKFVHRMRHLKVSQTMERWVDNVRERKQARYVLRSLSIKLRKRNLSKGW